jgi:hypothetical protein
VAHLTPDPYASLIPHCLFDEPAEGMHHVGEGFGYQDPLASGAVFRLASLVGMTEPTIYKYLPPYKDGFKAPPKIVEAFEQAALLLGGIPDNY